MTERRTELARSIESIVGGDHLTEDPEFQIDGLSPKLIARPGSAEEVAACLRVCSESAAAVVPAGRMSWLQCGNPLKRADVLLSLDRMRRIVQYSPPDLTATVEAGLTLGELNAVSVRERQWLPLDPPGFRSASLGAIAACNSSGALRIGFGTPRDYVIGLRLAHADGAQSKSGGQVVKNVAGYDMNKLYVGSYGTLAVITELTFKLRPLAERSSTMMITSKNRGPLFQLATRVLASELQPASVVLTRRLSAALASSRPDDALLIRFIDSEPAVQHQVDWVMRSIDDSYRGTVLSADEADSTWAEVADFDQPAIRVKFSLPLSAVAAEFEKAFAAHPECVAAADIGAGIVRMAFDADEQSVVDQIKLLRASAVAVNGTLVIERAPAEVRRETDAWGDVGSTAGLMRLIKARFDPQSLLNPGRFVLGL
ncbi:MAG: FAD-binding oxidoreductase [Acidobacteriota bacterium]